MQLYRGEAYIIQRRAKEGNAEVETGQETGCNVKIDSLPPVSPSIQRHSVALHTVHINSCHFIFRTITFHFNISAFIHFYYILKFGTKIVFRAIIMFGIGFISILLKPILVLDHKSSVCFLTWNLNWVFLSLENMPSSSAKNRKKEVS